MQEIRFTKNQSKRVVVLGFFDSLHAGHRQLIATALQYAKTTSRALYVFTFSNNPYAELGEQVPLFYSFEERLKIIKTLGVDGVLSLPLDKNMLAADFVLSLKKSQTEVVFFGKDYCFGQNRGGNDNHFTSQSIKVFREDFLKVNEKKVSTSDIREQLLLGDVSTAATLLGANYRICGLVESGYRVGHTLGFPTANLSYSKNNVVLRAGVYGSIVTIESASYRGISNVGSRPTYHDDEKKVETYIHSFSGDLYGKEIIVEFVEYIRDIKKFASSEELKAQLEEDKKWCLK